MKYFCSMLTLAAALGLGYLGHCQANDKPAETPKPAVEAPKTTNGAITDEQLGTMLESMGYEVKPGTYQSGAKYYDVSLPTKSFQIHIRFGLSPNKRCVWLMSNLGDLPADVTLDQVKAVLQAVNSKTGKMQFRLTDKQLKADQPMDNFGVTAARLRYEITDFLAALDDTGDIWTFKKVGDKTAKQETK